MSSLNSISSEKLWRLIGVPRGPALIDVRVEESFAADPRFVPGTVRRVHTKVSDWGSEFAGRPAVVICENGQGLSEGCGLAASSPRILRRNSYRGPRRLGGSGPPAHPRKQTADA
jgi:hypothetical protein